MFELSYSLYRSEKKVLGVYSSYSKAFGEMLGMYQIVRYAQSSEFYIENLEDGKIHSFYDDGMELIAS